MSSRTPLSPAPSAGTSPFQIREIRPGDDAAVEAVIRSCLVEFGANREGFAWSDPNLGQFSQVYCHPGSRYWVVVSAQGEIVGGAGIGPLQGAEGVCELQKMYCLPQARGTGVAHRLMQTALAFAARHYRKCYLETFHTMAAANRFYQKYEFRQLEAPYLPTAHYACDIWYLRDL